MHQIKLVPASPFFNSCDLTVFDVKDGRDKKRCKITVEYAKVDVDDLKRKGHTDFDSAMQYYKEWLYAVVRHYIADEWECAEGYDETMNIIADHISRYYQEGDK